jgi:hypothetical protein
MSSKVVKVNDYCTYFIKEEQKIVTVHHLIYPPKSDHYFLATASQLKDNLYNFFYFLFLSGFLYGDVKEIHDKLTEEYKEYKLDLILYYFIDLDGFRAQDFKGFSESTRTTLTAILNAENLGDILYTLGKDILKSFRGDIIELFISKFNWFDVKVYFRTYDNKKGFRDYDEPLIKSIINDK